MSMRAQVSLIFDDEELYEQFIQPYKEQKLLNSVIIRCLTAYYYNDEVRGMIEGEQADASSEESDDHMRSIIENMRNSLLVQDFLVNEAVNTLGVGAENIEDILHTANTLAKETGVATPTTTESGSVILQINTSKLENVEAEQRSEAPAQEHTWSSEGSVIANCLVLLAKKLGDTEIEGILRSSGMLGENVKSSDVVETPMQTAEPERVISQPVVPQVSAPPVVEETKQVAIVDDFAPDTMPAQVEESSDASDAMKELLGSLDF